MSWLLFLLIMVAVLVPLGLVFTLLTRSTPVGRPGSGPARRGRSGVRGGLDGWPVDSGGDGGGGD